jgi:hemoglobin-like flavoprotein
MAVDALMAALQDVLQNEMAPETAQAWKKAIQELVSHMAPQNA